MKLRSIILLIFITVLAFFCRFYKISDVPASLARDEVSATYNAYSILKTGRDEHGIFLPIVFKAFGDWKLPVEVYFAIPGVWLFGLNEFSARLPEALLGSLSIPLFYLVIRKITKEKKGVVSLLAAFFLAISPWHIYMSRVAIGYNVLGLFFFLLGVYFFFSFLEGKKWYLLFANISFIFTLFSYTAFHIFTPLFILMLYFLYRNEIPLNRFVRIQIIIFVIFYTIASYSVLEANVQKIAGTSLWHDQEFYKTEVFDKRVNHNNTFLSKIIHNKPFAYITKLSTNYISTFSPEFLVTKGAVNPINNLKDMGNMYVVEYVLFVFGTIFLVTKKEKYSKVIVAWLLLGAVPAIITKEAPQSTRNLVMIPGISFLSAFGLYSLCTFFTEKEGLKRIIFGCALLFVLFFGMWNIIQFLDNYFNHLDRDRGGYWNAGYKEIVSFINEKRPLKVVMADQSRSPYIYFAFYNAYDPEMFRGNVKWASPTWDNFVHVDSLDNYFFVEQIDFSRDIVSKNTLYIARLEQFPQDYPIDGIITDKTGVYKFGWIYTDNKYCKKDFYSINKPQVCL